MKELLKKWVPKSIILFIKTQKMRLKLFSAYYYDLKRYLKYSSAVTYSNTEEKLLANIIRNYHVVEKGLTMPETRLGFGKPRLMNLAKDCIKYVSSHGKNNAQLQHAIDVIFEYKQLHKDNQFKLDDDILHYIDSLSQFRASQVKHSQTDITSEEYFSNRNSAFDVFSKSRASVRNYSSVNLPIEMIKDSVQLALNAPSACNRQTVRTFVYTDPAKIAKLLELQGGNRGFGHLANKLIIITAEVGVFINPSERNQAFIDGGIFAMNLLYSLHYNGVAGCILNCSHNPEKDRKIRQFCDAKDSQVFIAMISCGYPPDNFKLAKSKRHDLETVYKQF